MLVYHGTSELYWSNILNEGLRPRSERAGNWQHTVDSNPKMVYLTNAYAGYFAFSATVDEERMVIIEIETNKLAQGSFYPDEDFIAQVIYHKQKDEPGARETLLETTKMVRDNSRTFRKYWRDSLNGMGNCCYMGNIPISAMTRVSFLPWHPFFIAVIDPSISILNYKYCGDKYQMLTRIMMGDIPSWEEYRASDISMKALSAEHKLLEQARKQFEDAMSEIRGQIKVINSKGGWGKCLK